MKHRETRILPIMNTDLSVSMYYNKKKKKKEKKMKGDRYFSNVPFQFNKMLPSLPPETLSKRSCAI